MQDRAPAVRLATRVAISFRLTFVVEQTDIQAEMRLYHVKAAWRR